MSRQMAVAALLCLTTLPAQANEGQELPPGLAGARLLPGWTDAQGNRIAALELELLPGWKTYWRNPGDSGLPPSFDWEGSQNLDQVTFHWPAPEAIRSGGDLTLGYHDRLILPFTATPAQPDQPITLRASVDLGLCERICVPAFLTLQAPPAGDRPDPRIADALARQPRPAEGQASCEAQPIADGMRLRVNLPVEQAQVAAMEVIGQPDIWVSLAQIRHEFDGAWATADFVPPSGEPFDLDTSQVLITTIGPLGAQQLTGCQPIG